MRDKDVCPSARARISVEVQCTAVEREAWRELHAGGVDRVTEVDWRLPRALDTGAVRDRKIHAALGAGQIGPVRADVQCEAILRNGRM